MLSVKTDLIYDRMVLFFFQKGKQIDNKILQLYTNIAQDFR